MTNPATVGITGVAGFIGSHLAERLLAEGRTVVGIDDFSHGSPSNMDTFRNLQSVARVVREQLAEQHA